MKKDRERGNIAATAAKRQLAFDHAITLIEPLNQARRDLRSAGHDQNYSAIARWLNARDFKSVNRKTFRPETINRLLNETERTIGKAAISECDTEIAVLVYEFRHLSADQQAERADADNATIERFKARCFARLYEAIMLGRELRGDGEISEARIREAALTLEADLRIILKSSKAPAKLYALRVLSSSHERRKRPPIEVRRARKEAREEKASPDPQLSFAIPEQ